MLVQLRHNMVPELTSDNSQFHYDESLLFYILWHWSWLKLTMWFFMTL